MKKQIKHTDRANPGWIEHKAGFILSLFFHILLFSMLLKKTSTKEVQNIMVMPSLNMELIMPEEMTIAPPPEILPSEAQATHSQDSPEESQAPNPSKDQVIESGEKGKDTGSQISEDTLAEFRRETAREQNDLGRSLSGIQGELKRRSFSSKGVKADFDSAGTEKGIIRILDVGDTPEKITDAVFRRYNIRIVQKYIEEENPFNYLNRVKTRGKTFLSQKGAGFYEVFEIPPQAMKKMTLLEQEEMQKKGLNANKTHVSKIVFGIVEKEGTFDLGIKDFEYQELE